MGRPLAQPDVLRLGYVSAVFAAYALLPAPSADYDDQQDRIAPELGRRSIWPGIIYSQGTPSRVTRSNLTLQD